MRTERGEQPHQEIRLGQNPRLIWLTKLMSGRGQFQYPPLATLAKEFCQTPVASPQRGISNLQGMFLEFILREFLKTAEALFPTEIQLDPIQKKYPHLLDPEENTSERRVARIQEKENKRFFGLHNNNLVVEYIKHYKNGSVGIQQSTDYDATALIEGMPVVFEIKSLKPGRDRGLRQKVNPIQLQSTLLPIAEEFDTSTVGYVCVTTEGVTSRYSTPPVEFVQQGGIIVELPFSSEEVSKTLIALFPSLALPGKSYQNARI